MDDKNIWETLNEEDLKRLEAALRYKLTNEQKKAIATFLLEDLNDLLTDQQKDKPIYKAAEYENYINAKLEEIENKYKDNDEKPTKKQLKELERLETITKEQEKERKKMRDELLNFLNSLEAGTSKTKKSDITTVITKRPIAFLTPIDKVSNKAFDGLLNSNELITVAMEKRGSKKEINTLVNINFNNMQSVTINGKKELTPYDREVYDAIITLYVDGKNEIITPQMIYQTMTGNPNNFLNEKAKKEIQNAITKLMYSDVTIDATQEAEAFGFDTFKYSGNLLHAERITARINNNEVDAIHIIKKPVLYDYAERKNQIGRVDIKLLNSPINKNNEIIALQGYLMRRILSMKSGKLSNSILYETIYKQIEIEAATDGALRKKKTKVREQVKKILDYWKQESFIKAYTENKKGNAVYSITIGL